MQINPGGYLDNKGSFRDTPPPPSWSPVAFRYEPTKRAVRNGQLLVRVLIGLAKLPVFAVAWHSQTG